MMDSGPGRHWQPSAGKSADINYDIRTDHLVKSRREAPGIGWRKPVHSGTLGTVNLGQSGFERRLNEQKTLIVSNIAGTYQIAVISIKE
jgi:predicted GTPase